MSLQRPRSAFGQLHRAPQRALGLVVFVQPLEDAAEEGISGYELRRTALQLTLYAQRLLGMPACLLVLLLAHGDVDERVLDRRTRFAHRVVVVDQDGLSPIEVLPGSGEIALRELNLRQADENLL